MKRRLELFAVSDRGKLFFQILQWLFLGAILLWLGLSLYKIGWQAVWQNLPVHPLFYLLFLIMFLSVPIADILIYRYTWTFDVWKNIHAFIKKRILNTDVVGYSGEVYFFTWARTHAGLSDLKVAETIRDYNILSALASNSRAIIFLCIFGYWAREQIAMLIGAPSPIYFVIGGVVLLVLIPLFIRFRRYIFVTPFKTARVVFGIYFSRLAVGTVLQIVMWAVVIPEVPLETWITYSVISILVSRLPTSNKKLIFVGVGVELSTSLDIPKEAMFGLLISIAALEKILNFLLYLSFTLWQKFFAKGLESEISGLAEDQVDSALESKNF